MNPDPRRRDIEAHANDLVERVMGCPPVRHIGCEWAWFAEWRGDGKNGSNSPSLRWNPEKRRGFDNAAGNESFDIIGLYARKNRLDCQRDFRQILDALDAMRGNGHRSTASPAPRPMAPRHDPGPGPRPEPEAVAALAKCYGLLPGDFREAGCPSLAEVFFPIIDRKAWGLLYPLRTLDGSDRKKAKSVLRFDGDGNPVAWPAGKRACVHVPKGPAGFFPPAAVEGEGALVVTAGEEKALALAKAGFRAVSYSAGEGGLPPEAARFLVERGNLEFCVVMDGDDAGRRGAKKTAQALKDAGATALWVVTWPPDSPRGWDANDELREHGEDRLRLTIALAPEWPGEDPEPAAVEPQADPGPDLETVEPEGATVAGEPEPWAPLVALDRFDPPEFPLDALAGAPWLQSWVAGVSQQYQTPPDLPALLALATIAGAVQTRACVLAREGYSEPLMLWACVALPPGNRKSQVFAEALAPVFAWQREAAAETRVARETAAECGRMIEERIATLRKAGAKSPDAETRRGRAEEIAKLKAEADAAAPAAAPRILFDDTTPEALGVAMAAQGGAALVASPEGRLFDVLRGCFSEMPDLSIFLKGHAGDSVDVSRLGRPPVTMPRPCLSLALAVQPQAIRPLGKGDVFAGLGLLARFIFAIPASTVGRRRVGAPACPEGVRAVYAGRVGALLDLPRCSTVAALMLDPEARHAFEEFERNLEPRLDPETGDLGAGLSSWPSKLAGLVLRFSGLLHFATHGAGAFEHRVEGSTLAQAVRLAGWATEHARGAFDHLGANPATDGARRVLAWIERTRPADFLQSQAWESVKTSLRTAAALRESLRLLESRAYLRALERPQESRGPGRPGLRFIVRPRLFPEKGFGDSSNSCGGVEDENRD